VAVAFRLCFALALPMNGLKKNDLKKAFEPRDIIEIFSGL